MEENAPEILASSIDNVSEASPCRVCSVGLERSAKYSNEQKSNQAEELRLICALMSSYLCLEE